MTDTQPAPLLDLDDVARLREALTRADYTSAGIAGRIGAQAVDEQGQVGGIEATIDRCPGDGVDLVGQNGFGVEQQPAHQGGLAVVDAAGRGQAQEFRLAPRATLVKVAHDQK